MAVKLILNSKYVKLLFLFLFIAFSSQATTYYVNPSGNDYDSGTSVENAWKSVLAINSRKFLPGDIILFEGGRTFSGGLYFDATDRGTPQEPITISSYGNGKATISSGGKYGMYVYNTAGFKVSNLVFKGSGRTTNKMAGVFFFMDLGNTRLNYINLDKLEVYGYRGAGIVIGSDNHASGFDNVKITNSSAHDNGVAGINSYAQATLGHRNFYISNNKVYNNPGIPEERRIHTGSGIMLSGIDGATVEYCEAYNNGWLNGHDGGGPVGIWGYNCNNLVIQHNESHHNRTGTTKDGGGFDLDGGCTNSVMQYNYSHDNDGAGYLLAQYNGAPEMKNLVIRYNISENDGRKNSNGSILLWATSSSGGIQDVDIYNNTIYLSPANNGSPTGVFVSTGNFSDTRIRNNIIQTSGGLQAVRVLANTGVRFEGNAYWASGDAFKIYWTGATYTSLEQWRSALKQEMLNGKPVGVFADPEFNNPGKGGTIGDPEQLQTISAYKLKPGSELIGQGLNLKATFGLNTGNLDFWKNDVSKKQSYNVGAYQDGEKVSTTQKSQVITFPEITDKVWGIEPFALQATASSGLPISYTIVAGPATIDNNVLTITGVGNVTVTASQKGNADYKAAPVIMQQFKVSKKALLATTISFNLVPNKKVGDDPFELIATSNHSETPIQFTSSDSEVITVTKKKNEWVATVKEAGIATITASQAGNDEYAAATSVVRTVKVGAPATPPGQEPPVTSEKPHATRYEAETYDNMNGIETENTSDVDGGLNVGWVNSDDWLQYTVRVNASGTYLLKFRVSGTEAGQFEVRNSAKTVLKTVEVPNTGSWQNWTTLSVPVKLDAGSQTIQLYVKEPGWNLNWFEIPNKTVADEILDKEQNRIKVVAVNAAEDTGMDYTPWLNDDVNSVIAPVWERENNKYVDVKLTLESRSKISEVLLFDGEGKFTDIPVEVYALNGENKIYLGQFTGDSYLTWVAIEGKNQLADAVILRKHSNALPLKVKVFGTPVATSIARNSTINPNASELNSSENATLDVGASWSIYPNPTPDKVEVTLDQRIQGEVIIDVLDLEGNLLQHLTLQKKNDILVQSISLAHQKKGLYFIKLRANEINTEKKVIKR